MKNLLNKFQKGRVVDISNYYQYLYKRGYECIVIYLMKDNTLKYKTYYNATSAQLLFNRWKIFEVYIKRNNQWVSYYNSWRE